MERRGSRPRVCSGTAATERGGNKDIKIRIPRKFKPVHMVLLKDLKDRAVTELRCHLCPETKFES